LPTTLDTVDLGIITSYEYRNRMVSISGYVTSQTALEQIRVLFERVAGNVVFADVWKEGRIGFDLTPNKDNTKNLSSDLPYIKTGNHLLVDFTYTSSDKANHFPYTMTLWYKG